MWLDSWLFSYCDIKYEVIENSLPKRKYFPISKFSLPWKKLHIFSLQVEFVLIMKAL